MEKIKISKNEESVFFEFENEKYKFIKSKDIIIEGFFKCLEKNYNNSYPYDFFKNHELDFNNDITEELKERIKIIIKEFDVILQDIKNNG